MQSYLLGAPAAAARPAIHNLVPPHTDPLTFKEFPSDRKPKRRSLDRRRF